MSKINNLRVQYTTYEAELTDKMKELSEIKQNIQKLKEKAIQIYLKKYRGPCKHIHNAGFNQICWHLDNLHKFRSCNSTTCPFAKLK